MNDPYNLSRFIEAQDSTYSSILGELKRGTKTEHWMWYTFPQLKGLGHSAMSQRYSISSIDEANAYRAHAVLGFRLVECTAFVMAVKGKTIQQIFGHPDYLKFQSCMTFFVATEDCSEVFQQALDKFFDGKPDHSTIQLLENR